MVNHTFTLIYFKEREVITINIQWAKMHEGILPVLRQGFDSLSPSSQGL
jgi:hypothetical protein